MKSTAEIEIRMELLIHECGLRFRFCWGLISPNRTLVLMAKTFSKRETSMKKDKFVVYRINSGKTFYGHNTANKTISD